MDNTGTSQPVISDMKVLYHPPATTLSKQDSASYTHSSHKPLKPSTYIMGYSHLYVACWRIMQAINVFFFNWSSDQGDLQTAKLNKSRRHGCHFVLPTTLNQLCQSKILIANTSTGDIHSWLSLALLHIRYLVCLLTTFALSIHTETTQCLN